MAQNSNYCTCRDTDCPLHPANHDKGCTPCILKNLKLKEIPSCFFNALEHREKRDTYFFADFAEAVCYDKAMREQNSESHE